MIDDSPLYKAKSEIQVREAKENEQAVWQAGLRGLSAVAGRPLRSPEEAWGRPWLALLVDFLEPHETE